MPHISGTFACLDRTTPKSVDDGSDDSVCTCNRLRPATRDPSSRMSSLKRGNFAADTCAVEGNAAEHLFDAADETHVAADDPAAERAPRPRRAERRRPAEALRPPDRRRPPAHAGGGARARPSQGRGRRSGQAATDRVQPQARHVDHPQLHAGRGAAPRPHPGGQPRTDPSRREVRLQAGLQALDLRNVVDQAVGLARAGRAGADDPATRPRRRPGAQGHQDAPAARAEAQSRSVARRDRPRDRHHARARTGAARPRPGPGQPGDPDRRR